MILCAPRHNDFFITFLMCSNHSCYREMLSLGSSKPWPDVMEIMTGQRKMDVGPLMDYFQPLTDWLEKENYLERPGWSNACPKPTKAVKCPSSEREISAAPRYSVNRELVLMSVLIVISFFTLR